MTQKRKPPMARLPDSAPSTGSKIVFDDATMYAVLNTVAAYRAFKDVQDKPGMMDDERMMFVILSGLELIEESLLKNFNAEAHALYKRNVAEIAKDAAEDAAAQRQKMN